MGYAGAEAAARRGAKVVLVSGPVALGVPEGVERVSVRSAEEMYRAVTPRFAECTVAILAAAVADYRPVETHTQKMKRSKSAITVQFEPTRDILAEIAKSKGNRLVVGFAAETDHVAENARKKLEAKNVDLIVANDVTAEGAGFDVDTNKVTLFARDARDLALPRMAKSEAAHKILDEIIRLRSALRAKPVTRGSAE